MRCPSRRSSILRPRSSRCPRAAPSTPARPTEVTATPSEPDRPGTGHAIDHAVAHANGPAVDLPRAEAAIRELLFAVGENPNREGLLDTPARVARAYGEI